MVSNVAVNVSNVKFQKVTIKKYNYAEYFQPNKIFRTWAVESRFENILPKILDYTCILFSSHTVLYLCLAFWGFLYEQFQFSYFLHLAKPFFLRILEETLSLDLDKLQAKYQALLDGDMNQFKSIQNGTTVPDNLDLNQNGVKSFSNSTFLNGWLTGNRDSKIRFESSNTDSGPTDLEIFCPKMQSRLTVSNDEIQVVAPDRFQTRCYVNCPDGFITYGRRCYSKCKITPKDELSLLEKFMKIMLPVYLMIKFDIPR